MNTGKKLGCKFRDGNNAVYVICIYKKYAGLNEIGLKVELGNN